MGRQAGVVSGRGDFTHEMGFEAGAVSGKGDYTHGIGHQAGTVSGKGYCTHGMGFQADLGNVFRQKCRRHPRTIPYHILRQRFHPTMLPNPSENMSVSGRAGSEHGQGFEAGVVSGKDDYAHGIGFQSGLRQRFPPKMSPAYSYHSIPYSPATFPPGNVAEFLREYVCERKGGFYARDRVQSRCRERKGRFHARDGIILGREGTGRGGT